MPFPRNRPRRLRRTPEIRDLVREVRVETKDLVLPLFCVTGRGVREPVASMPGVERLSVDQLAVEAKEIRDLGIPAVILFGIPDRKDALGSGAYDPDGVVQGAIGALKDSAPELVVIADVCLCEYTDHGHCGVYDGRDVQNDATLPLIAKTAVSVARAGADIVAPSDMMDGRIRAVRDALDGEGLEQTPVLSYAAKYSSAFYGPFRDAAESTPQQGDRRGYRPSQPKPGALLAPHRPGGAGGLLHRSHRGGNRPVQPREQRLAGNGRFRRAPGGLGGADLHRLPGDPLV